MPNIAGVLKEEIRRLAKKEIKAQVGTPNRPWPIPQRHRQAEAAAEPTGTGDQAAEEAAGPSQTEEEPLESVRFSARSVKAQRSRLGLSADDYGKLVGVSGLDHLQLGTREIPPPQGPTCCIGRRSWHRQEGSVDEVGGIDAEEEAGKRR